MGFDIRAAVARLKSRATEYDRYSVSNQTLSQFNTLLRASREKYLESLDIQGLLTLTSLSSVKELLDTMSRLMEALDALPSEVDDDSPTLSQKFGILRAESQLIKDFSAYIDDSGGLGLLFFDIDYFKALNTKYTETVVDNKILAPFQRVLNNVTQSRGFAYSVGGDEFLVLLRNAGSSETKAFADRLLDFVRTLPFCVNGFDEHLTLSIGVACYPGDAQELNVLRELANRAENGAKKAGRNMVVCSSDSAD